ncbi:MAG: nitrite/sulfite reductase [Acidimicrobiia bacterium]|nr:nitrite/sulfite reductase [Acidimicrobiia bacterium]
MTQTIRPTSAAEVAIDLTAITDIAAADIDDFERYAAERDAGILPEEDFRRIRLNNGIYGIRHEDRLHMVRIKLPQGKVAPAQMRVLAKVADEFSRGFAHITTRQCFQVHLVRIEDVPTVMRHLASAGLTTREACGDTVRNVQADPLAGLVPDHPFDVTPWGRATTDHFLRNPAAQRLPRKFKINFSGNDDDLGQTAINDIGAIATRHAATGDLGFRVYVGGGLGATPHEAKLLEPFTRLEDAIPTFEAILRVFDRHGNRENRNRARLKWLLAEIGIEAFREMVFAERHAVIAVSGTNQGIPQAVLDAGGHLPLPAGEIVPLPVDTGDPDFDRWIETNATATLDGRVAVYMTTPLGDITTRQFLALADVMEDFAPPDADHVDTRVTNRQNVLLRGIEAERLFDLWKRLDEIGFGEADAHRASDPVSCPGADTCNLAFTQSRGLAKAVRAKVLEAGLGSAPIKINISGCSNSCGQHHLGDIGFFGMERRIDGTPAPGYQLMVGGGLDADQARFGTKVRRLPAKRVPEVVVELIARYERERAAGESFRAWSDRVGRDPLAEMLAGFDEIPSFEDDPDAYVDWDETTPFAVNLGQGECA